MSREMNVVAFIPARSGSKRVPDKNIKLLGGHPLLAYAVSGALASGVFTSVICVTDDPKYADIARYYGAEVPALRPAATSGDKSPDIDWVLWILEFLQNQSRDFKAFSILRPTSPFRGPETIRRAWATFRADEMADSLRAVGRCRQHPGKMWVLRHGRLLPLMPFQNGVTPWHSSQYAALPEIYIQDASLEIAWTRVPLEYSSIAGEAIIPFISQGLEGFDINDPEDWILAEHYLASGQASLPVLKTPPHENGKEHS